MPRNDLSHTLRQYRQETASHVSPVQFRKRIEACTSCSLRRDVDCSQFSAKCATLAGNSLQSCDCWGEVKTRPSVSGLAVVACYFNPTGCEFRRNNLVEFREKLDAPVLVIEASFDGDFVFDDSIQVRATEKNRFLWQKERLLNLAIETLPPHVDAVAMIDADLVFKSKTWYRETLARLQFADVVQMFDSVDYLDDSKKLDVSQTGYAYEQQQEKPSPGLPGGAVAVRRSLLKKESTGLIENRIVGGGDSATMKRWKSEGLFIDYTRGGVLHLYHGRYADRAATARYDILKKHNFDPSRDVRVGVNGLLEWSTKKPKLREDVKAYFNERAELAIEKKHPEPPAEGPRSPVNRDDEAERVKKKQPPRRVDVFMPYHSGLEFVAESVNSILWQKEIETIIHLVNDCSPENDADLFEKFGSLDNIRWYKTKENVGPYQIYNALVDKMETDFFALQGADDIATPSRLALSFEKMSETGASVFFAAMENFLTPLGKSGECHEKNSIEYLNRRPVYTSSLNGPLVNGTMLISKKLFEKLNGFENEFCGCDTEFSERLKRSGEKISIANDRVALRRLHSKNLSLREGPHGQDSPERFEISERWKERFKAWDKNPSSLRSGNYGGLSSVGDILIKNIGSGSKIWAGASVSPSAVIGEGCTIGQRVEIGAGAVIGDRVNLQTGVFISPGSKIGDDVFMGPYCILTNDKHPPSGGRCWEPVTVERGASLGAASVLLPGVSVGSNAVVGAASVVTRDVPPNSTSYGNPSRVQSVESVHVGIATYPPRLRSLIETLESLTDQVDAIHICLNEYDSIPFELGRFKNLVCTIPEQNLGDLGKFLALPGLAGYFLACDDDLIYPKDYAVSMITAQRRNGGVVSHHGRVFPTGRSIKSYYTDIEKYSHCLREVGEPHEAHAVGTGVACFRPEEVAFRIEESHAANMADVHLAAFASRAGVRLTVLNHGADWIKHSPHIDSKKTIWYNSRNDDREQTRIINELELKQL